jgi:hypothetical protein
MNFLLERLRLIDDDAESNAQTKLAIDLIVHDGVCVSCRNPYVRELKPDIMPWCFTCFSNMTDIFRF